MSDLLILLVIAVASYILSKSADLVVASVSSLARRFGVSEFNLGFFILGLATSTPELFVGLNSVIDATPELSLGNLIGASIILLSLIIGLTAILNKEVRFGNSFGRKDILLTSFVILSPAFLLFDGLLSRFDGLFLIVFYVLFYLFLNRQQSFAERIEQKLSSHKLDFLKIAAKMLIGVAGLAITSKVIVEAAELMAVTWNLPLVLVGLVFLAIGTNLPELTIMFKSTVRNHKQIALGDFLGSAAANTPILGFIALLSPIQLTAPVKIYASLVMLFISLVTFNAFFQSERKLTRLEGAALVGLYGFFLFMELFLRNQL